MRMHAETRCKISLIISAIILPRRGRKLQLLRLRINKGRRFCVLSAKNNEAQRTHRRSANRGMFYRVRLWPRVSKLGLPAHERACVANSGKGSESAGSFRQRG